MTRAQEETIHEIDDRLRKTRHIVNKLRVKEFERIMYFEIEDVTVSIGIAGGINLPALRTYLDNVEAAVNADILFSRQRERDDANPLRAAAFKTGHFNGRFDPERNRCIGDRKCPHCQ
jgi:hypothetical protein